MVGEHKYRSISVVAFKIAFLISFYISFFSFFLFFLSLREGPGRDVVRGEGGGGWGNGGCKLGALNELF